MPPIRVPGQEHKYWMDDGEMNKQTSERMTGLFKNNRRIFTNAEVAKRVEPYEAGKDIVSGITGGCHQRAFGGPSFAHRVVGR